jgi:Suppressor of fused protein (SUFU)
MILDHGDLHIVPPTPERNWITVSARAAAQSELIMMLPAYWKIDDADERSQWPFRLLRTLAARATAPTHGETIANGKPYAPGLNVSAALITTALGLPAKDGLFQVTPITDAELRFKQENSAAALIDRLRNHDPDFFTAIDAERPCVIEPGAEAAVPSGYSRDIGNAWLVVPARRARDAVALDKLLARSSRSSELRVRHALGTKGVQLVEVFGSPLKEIAAAMSHVEHSSAALRIAGERALVHLFHDGAVVSEARLPPIEAATAAAEHLGATYDDFLAASEAPREVRIVRWERGGKQDPDNPNVVWDVNIDDEFEIALGAEVLSEVPRPILDRYRAWRRALTAPAPEPRRRAHAELLSTAQTILSPAHHRLAVEALGRMLINHGASPDAIKRFRDR